MALLHNIMKTSEGADRIRGITVNNDGNLPENFHSRHTYTDDGETRRYTKIRNKISNDFAVASTNVVTEHLMRLVAGSILPRRNPNFSATEKKKKKRRILPWSSAYVRLMIKLYLTCVCVNKTVTSHHRWSGMSMEGSHPVTAPVENEPRSS